MSTITPPWTSLVARSSSTSWIPFSQTRSDEFTEIDIVPTKKEVTSPKIPKGKHPKRKGKDNTELHLKYASFSQQTGFPNQITVPIDKMVAIIHEITMVGSYTSLVKIQNSFVTFIQIHYHFLRISHCTQIIKQWIGQNHSSATIRTIITNSINSIKQIIKKNQNQNQNHISEKNNNRYKKLEILLLTQANI